MASSERVRLTTPKIEMKLPCIKCTGNTNHKVLVSIEVYGEETYGEEVFASRPLFHWSDDYQIVQCSGCKSKSFRNVKSNSNDSYQISATEWETEEIEHLYPSRIEACSSLQNEEHYLPNQIRNIYKETICALSNHLPVLAGIGLRALIETICKEKNAVGKNLFLKIDDLVTKQILTPAGSKILHKIRTLGNLAVHEVKPHNEQQLGLAMDVVEHILKDVYIIPSKVKSEFGE